LGELKYAQKQMYAYVVPIVILLINGKHGTRGLFGKDGKRCPSKDVNGAFLEEAVWNDIEQFLHWTEMPVLFNGRDMTAL
jgi:hypothetical protein